MIKDDLLAQTLDDAGLLAPMMAVATEQLEDIKQRRPTTAAREILREHFPEASEEELDTLEQVT